MCIEIFDVQWPVQRVLQITVYHRITGWLCHWCTTSTVPQESEILLTSISGMFVYVQKYYKLQSITESLAGYAIGALHLQYHKRVKFYLLLFQVCLCTYKPSTYYANSTKSHFACVQRIFIHRSTCTR